MPLIWLVVILVISTLFWASVLYLTGIVLVRKTGLLILTKREVFEGASAAQFMAWRKIETTAVVLYMILWLSLFIGLLVTTVLNSLQIWYMYKGNHMAWQRIDQWTHPQRPWGDLASLLPFVWFSIGVIIERAARLFGEKVGIDWPGRVEEVHNMSPGPDIMGAIRAPFPTSVPRLEDLQRYEEPEERKTYLLAIDPGRYNCGLAVLDRDGQVAAKTYCKRERVGEVMSDLVSQYKPASLALGNGTDSSETAKIAEDLLPGKVALVPAKGAAFEARELAWRTRAPRRTPHWLPMILRPELIDLPAWAAVVIGRRFLGTK
jgi:hypothetical protein